MNLMPLMNRLESLGLGTRGNDLFLNVLPADATQGTVLRDSLSGTPINYEMPGYFKATFAVVVRIPLADYQSGLDRMKTLTNALTLQNLQVENQFFKFVRPRTQPVTYPLANGAVLEISTRFDANFLEQA